MSLDQRRHSIQEARDIIEANLSTIRSIHTGLDSIAADSVTSEFRPFRTAGTYFGTYETYGGEISDEDREFYSTREPIVKWLVYWVAQDIWDNWFKIIDPEKPEDDSLDRAVQRVLKQLHAKRELKRSTVFERRYGWSIILCGYAGFDDNTWENPIYDENGKLKDNVKKLLQIIAYPGEDSKVSVAGENEDSSSLRYGLPETYTVLRGGDRTTQTTVHWSRVIHDAPRLDEHLWEGVSVIDGIFDDAVGFRNSRWGQYQTIFRYGSGFPVIYIPGASRRQINQMISDGEFSNISSRTYFVVGGDPDAREEIDFKGVQDVTLNPDPYNTVAFASMAMGTRIPQDILKGVSAGRITGSEVNERSYYKLITAEQDPKEETLRELIDRLIDTGQIEYDDGRKNPPTKDYGVKWNYPSLVTERDRATIEYLEERARTEMLEYSTIDEVRVKKAGLKPLPNDEGKVVLGIKRLERMGGESFIPSPTRKPEESKVEDKNINDTDKDNVEEEWQNNILNEALEKGR